MYPGPSGNRYSLENAREGLAPGGWYYDALLERLEYYPLPGAAGAPADAVVGFLPSALLASAGASDLEFQGLALAHSTTGPAAWFHGVSDVVLSQVSVAHSQGQGLKISNSSRVLVERCHVSDTGTDGIFLCDNIDTDADGNNGIAVRDSLVERTGLSPDAGQTFGIRLCGTDNITVLHNEVRGSTYGGIGLGWQWGPEPTAFTWPIFNVSFNHVHAFGFLQILSDFGGIYASGLCPPTEDTTSAKCQINAHVYQNVVHNGTCFNYGCNGLYGDL